MNALSDSNFNVDFTDRVSFGPFIIAYLRLYTCEVICHVKIFDSPGNILLVIRKSRVAILTRMHPLRVILFYIFVDSDNCEI